VSVSRNCSPPDGRLVSRTQLTQSAIRRLVHEFEALHQPPAKHLFTTCPAFAQPVVAHLEYGGRHSVDVYVDLNCFFATNGDLTRRGPKDVETRLTNDLARLTGAN
jgi:hypothetical protein